MNLLFAQVFTRFFSLKLHLRKDNQKTTIGPWILAMKLHDPFCPSNSSVLDHAGWYPRGLLIRTPPWEGDVSHLECQHVGYNLCCIGSTCEKWSKRRERNRAYYKIYVDGKRHFTISY